MTTLHFALSLKNVPQALAMSIYKKFLHFFSTITWYSIVWMYYNLFNQAVLNFCFSGAESFSFVQLFVTPWAIACQAPLSMGILQARIVKWVAMLSSRDSSRPRDRTQVSYTAGGFFTIWATRVFFFFSNLSNDAMNILHVYSESESISHLVIWLFATPWTV